MQKKPILIANWKMNLSLEDARRLFLQFRKSIMSMKALRSQVIVCPAYVYLPELKKLLGRVQKISLGAQDVFYEQEGAYTGEVSSMMIAPFAQYSLVGHSERRAYFGETDDVVNRKVHALLNERQIPIVCIGEQLEDYQKGETADVLRRQLRGAIKNVPKSRILKIILAYEPVWSISTMSANPKTPTENEIMSVQLFLRKELSTIYTRAIAERIPILYGGSVNSRNVTTFVGSGKMDGALVGGASLRASEFLSILRKVNSSYSS